MTAVALPRVKVKRRRRRRHPLFKLAVFFILVEVVFAGFYAMRAVAGEPFYVGVVAAAIMWIRWYWPFATWDGEGAMPGMDIPWPTFGVSALATLMLLL